MSQPLKNVHIITKTIWHCLIGMIEYMGIPLLLAYLTTFIEPISGVNFLWQWIERTAFCFTIYEVVLVGIRKMQIDTRKDALLALKTAYERAALYCQSNKTAIYEHLIQKINMVLDNGVLNQLDVIRSYENLKKYMDTQNTTAIQYEIINLQHAIETDHLLWNYTLLLRLFKR